jgi:hypothetical protein
MQRDVSIDYLRATLTLMVLAHHSSLAYTTFAHFDAAHYLSSTAPIVDPARWAFLDYAENFNDVFFMTLMFFVSGLFVLPALARHGAMAFLRDRLLRLGLPFAAAVTFVMPLAYYASWRLTGHDTGYLSYWRRNIFHDHWPPGPAWFIWVLLLFDVIAAAVFLAWPRIRLASTAAPSSPVRLFRFLFAASFVAYVPLLWKFGFGLWVPFFTPPFWFQLPRFLLYLLWFFAGAVIGRAGLNAGLLSRGGPLARHWPRWLALSVLAYNALQFRPQAGGDALYASLWVLSCTASCFGFLALFRGAVRKRHAWMDSLARSAYIMYLVHYVFVTWVQYYLLRIAAPASVKFLVTFALVTALSWTAAQLLLRVPKLASIL